MNNKVKNRMRKLAGIISERVEIHKDVLGQKYVAFYFSPGEVKPFLTKVRNLHTPQEYAEYVRNQKTRDRGKHHITIISPGEFGKLESQGIKITNADLPVGAPKLMGLGMATKKENMAYYIIVDFPEGNIFRESLGLPPKDFHITLAYKGNDVHEVPKGIETKID
jgi:hypothetical protein